MQIIASDNNFYFNIFHDITFSANEHADNANSGWGIANLSTTTCDACGTTNADNNYYFNNTFYNLNQLAV